MKILYAIQGTGNGHVCRAQEIVPILSRKADVDVLISGIQSDVHLPLPVKYVFNGMSFIFGKKGGVDLFETYRKSHLKQLLNEIDSLPVEEYDLVISDFEPVSSWACEMKNKPCIALSHQSAVINKKSPQPKHRDPVGKAVMKMYAPSSVQYGFHFARYDENIFTPVIRRKVRETMIGDAGHYTVYLPAYSDRRIIKVLSECPDVQWEVFSKHFEHQFESSNIKLFPVSDELFISSLATSRGVLCGAGFETPAEALYLKKKLLVIPMKNQFEQHCNAAALRNIGVPVMKSLKMKHLPVLKEWLISEENVIVDYPDETEAVIDHILAAHLIPRHSPDENGLFSFNGETVSVKHFKTLTLNKILSKLAK
jgi:uncharacterized protein (TIGR00661 family)